MSCCGKSPNNHNKNKNIKQINYNTINIKNDDIKKYPNDKYESNYYSKNNNYKIENFEESIIGFHNLGNTCYMNSFLQILFHCPGFLKALKDDCGDLFDQPCLIKSLIGLSENPRSFQCLKDIKKYMSDEYSEYGSSRQNDSQDFGKDLINKIIKNIGGEKEDSYSDGESECETENITIKDKIEKYDFYLKNLKSKDEKRILVEDLFQLIESEEKISYRGARLFFNTSLSIDLFFPKSNKEVYKLEDLFDFIYQNNCESNENMETIKGIKVKRKICHLPKILIINIERAIYGYELNSSILHIPQSFNLQNYINKDLIEKTENTNYELFAFNEKAGYSQSYGHYYCYISIKNEWYLFDDSYVSIDYPNFNSEKVVGLFYISKR